ncbi:MAG TPA: hypothetical protein VFW25_09945 [Silvibacterium sp.]|nr:hypothetical protein [Silvibacterium sp.]
MKLNSNLSERVQELAEKIHRPPEAILRDAIEQYMERKQPIGDGSEHPSGKPWPRRSPVGGIITPV